MSENVQIALIIVLGIVAVLLLALWVFKDKLDIFNFNASKKGVTAKMEQHKNTGISISGNTQAGNGNEIAAETANVSIENNRQDGDENVIRAAATSKK
ncbi:MAG: hypothetical protein NTY50_09640 [Methylobacter sp.]|nr:hypothetical protein [Methylobacter sp.]